MKQIIFLFTLLISSFLCVSVYASDYSVYFKVRTYKAYYLNGKKQWQELIDEADAKERVSASNENEAKIKAKSICSSHCDYKYGDKKETKDGVTYDVKTYKESVVSWVQKEI